MVKVLPNAKQTRLLRQLAAAGGRLIKTNTISGAQYTDLAGNVVLAKQALGLINNNHVIPEHDGLFDFTPQSGVSGCRGAGDERSAAHRKRSVFWGFVAAPQRHLPMGQYACGGAEAAGMNIVTLNLRVIGDNGIMAIVDLQMTKLAFLLASLHLATPQRARLDRAAM